MTGSRSGGAVAAGVLGGAVSLIVGLVPIVLVDVARRGGSLGTLSTVGLAVMVAIVVAVAVLAGAVIYRAGTAEETGPADVWIASFLTIVVWSVGVLTLVPGLVFLRLTEDVSLNDYGPRLFLEWALVYLVASAAAFFSGRWSLRSLTRAGARRPEAKAVTSS
ncbi:MAG: hypothetical protein BMS9Abin07_1567 [Acidimicrobiia bacterium]|nr:MAG: hypothetical protein BMS9Abin07_1567 [Acidimicrobiia bacterium]